MDNNMKELEDQYVASSKQKSSTNSVSSDATPDDIDKPSASDYNKAPEKPREHNTQRLYPAQIDDSEYGEHRPHHAQHYQPSNAADTKSTNTIDDFYQRLAGYKRTHAIFTSLSKVHGLETATTVLQHILDVIPDGVIGSKTIKRFFDLAIDDNEFSHRLDIIASEVLLVKQPKHTSPRTDPRDPCYSDRRDYVDPMYDYQRPPRESMRPSYGDRHRGAAYRIPEYHGVGPYAPQYTYSHQREINADNLLDLKQHVRAIASTVEKMMLVIDGIHLDQTTQQYPYTPHRGM